MRTGAPLASLLLATLLAIAACEKSATPRVPEERPSPTSSNGATLPLARYVVVVLGVEADYARVTGDLLETMAVTRSSSRLASLLRELVSLTAEHEQRLFAIAPPSEAQSYHETVLESIRHLALDAGGLADALEGGDLEEVGDDLLALLSSLSEELELSAEGDALVVRALEEDGQDAINAYLLSVLDLQQEFTPAGSRLIEEAAQAARRGSEERLIAAYEEVIAELEDLKTRWSALEPPPEATDIHHRQITVLDGLIRVEKLASAATQLHDAEALLRSLRQVTDLGIEATRLGAAWNELIISVLVD